MTSVLPECDSIGRKINYGGKNFRGIKARIERVRKMILNGYPTSEIRNATGSSPAIITRVRKALPRAVCGCGKPTTHPGTCSYRALTNNQRNATYAAPLTPKCKRFVARNPEIAPFFAAPNFESPRIRMLVGKFLRTGVFGPTEIVEIVAVSDADAAREQERLAGLGQEFAGVVGCRLLDLKLQIVSVKETKRRPSGVVSFTARARDEAGKLFVWNGCRRIVPVVGESYLMDGKVKAHEERDGLSVTFITRCSFPNPDAEKQAPNPEDKGHVLMQQIAKGCQKSFGLLRDLYYPLVRSISRSILRDDAAAVEDVAQETFLYLWVHAKRYTFKSLFKSYIAVMAKNTCLRRLRDRKKCKSIELNEGLNYHQAAY